MRDFRERGPRPPGPPPRGDRGKGGEGRRRGGRMRRGDIRTAVLAILVEEPGHGYDVIQRLEEKTEGAWRPSPGSVYPTLQLLEDEGLVRSVERNDKRVYEITEAGRTEATERIETAGGTPWEVAGRNDSGGGDFRNAVRKLLLGRPRSRDPTTVSSGEHSRAIDERPALPPSRAWPGDYATSRLMVPAPSTTKSTAMPISTARSPCTALDAKSAPLIMTSRSASTA